MGDTDVHMHVHNKSCTGCAYNSFTITPQPQKLAAELTPPADCTPPNYTIRNWHPGFLAQFSGRLS